MCSPFSSTVSLSSAMSSIDCEGRVSVTFPDFNASTDLLQVDEGLVGSCLPSEVYPACQLDAEMVQSARFREIECHAARGVKEGVSGHSLSLRGRLLLP